MSVKLQKMRGVLALVGPVVDDMAEAALKSEILRNTSLKRSPQRFHITFLSPPELDAISPQQISDIKANARQLYPVGVGGNTATGVYYVVVIWAAGQLLRKQLGLPPKQFHITLSFFDSHEMTKDIKTLLSGQVISDSSLEFLDHLAFTLQISGDYDEAQSYCVKSILLYPQSHKGFRRLGDSAFRNRQEKLAMLAYACAFRRSEDEKFNKQCLKRIIECSKSTEWGSLIQDDEIAQLPHEIAYLLLEPWSPILRNALSESKVVPTLLLESKVSLSIPSSLSCSNGPGFYKLPRFFRWLVPNHLAIMSTPRREEDIAALASPHLAIRHVLTLTEETPLPSDWFHNKDIMNTFLPIPNYHPPSIEQMDLIIHLLQNDKNLPMLIHCGGGKGRAGTVAACYLVAYGFKKPRLDRIQPQIAAKEAIVALRSLRPGSLETSQQEQFVSKWASTIWKRQSIIPDRPSEPAPCPMEIEGSLGENSDLFLLVGLPGSGKSWFSKSLIARDPSKWTYVSQDESGSRASCETAIGHAHGKVLLDRCNTAVNDRKQWLSLATKCTAPVCIWFDYDRELCISRAQMRAGHPSLPPGNRVRNAIDQMQASFAQPTLKEGFRAIVVIRSFAAANDLLLRLSPVSIFKFPRTPHLIDLGAATDDDVVNSLSSLPDDGHVVITEKVDGANMGFSLSADRSTFVVQNRSHYVSSSSHEQFKKLDFWIETHRDDLRKVLDRDPNFAERYILYGEWMFATHSISYTRLPDRFIAFDLYDRSTQMWADRKSLDKLLSGTSICSVPILHEGSMLTEGEILGMVQGQSKFYDGRMEGIYVKIEKNSCVISRGKVVRKDFIAGNEHWTKGQLRINSIVPDN